MRDSTDEDLLLSGEPEDFGHLYDRYVRSLLAYFQRRTRDPEAAADLTAETFAAALAARGRFEARSVPASVWLFSIAHHKLSDFQRRGAAEDHMRRRLGIERFPLGADDAEMIRLLGDEVAMELVRELPADQRDAVRAHVLEDRGYHDIARELTTSEATIRKRVSRGLTALRQRAGGLR
jgi:RNA polymerase sigma factor (sigma-70 family)